MGFDLVWHKINFPLLSSVTTSRVMARAVSHRHFSAGARVRTRVSTFGVYDRVFPCHYLSTMARYSYHLGNEQ
jgi:hypothetical protein